MDCKINLDKAETVADMILVRICGLTAQLQNTRSSGVAVLRSGVKLGLASPTTSARLLMSCFLISFNQFYQSATFVFSSHLELLSCRELLLC
jgi:hypothetical protein